MICCQFISKPATYDDEFHRLDWQIDEYARNLPGFEKVAKWESLKRQCRQRDRLLRQPEVRRPTRAVPAAPRGQGQGAPVVDGCRIVISEVTATYGDERLD